MSTEVLILVIGYAATAVTTFATLPQLIHIIKTKNTAGVSLLTYLIFMVSNLLWITYGLTVRGEGKIDFPLVIGDGIAFAINLLLVILKVSWSERER